MSKADEKFIAMCGDIIVNGFNSEGHEVRPKWEDGTPAHTIKKFGVINRYDLQEEFPALTLRKTFIKSAVEEMLWIWQRKSNHISNLNSHIWDEWAGEDGTIGKAYGYQQAIRYSYKDVTEEGLKKAFPEAVHNEIDSTYSYWQLPRKGIFLQGTTPIVAVKSGDCYRMTQIDKAIYDLVNNPLSRRIIVTMWNPRDLSEMKLEPCAYSMTFNVVGRRLNAILNQRSQDILAANNWNVVQYAVLMHMIAKHCNLIPGELVHVIADAHIYDRHVPLVMELISREPFPAPKFILNPEKTNFYDFNVDDIDIRDYQTHEQIKDIPIAV